MRPIPFAVETKRYWTPTGSSRARIPKLTENIGKRGYMLAPVCCLLSVFHNVSWESRRPSGYSAISVRMHLLAAAGQSMLLFRTLTARVYYIKLNFIHSNRNLSA